MNEFEQVWEDFKRWLKEPGNATSSLLLPDPSARDEIVNNAVTAEAAVSKYVALKNHKEFKDQLVKRCREEMPNQFKK